MRGIEAEPVDGALRCGAVGGGPVASTVHVAVSCKLREPKADDGTFLDAMISAWHAIISSFWLQLASACVSH